MHQQGLGILPGAAKPRARAGAATMQYMQGVHVRQWLQDGYLDPDVCPDSDPAYAVMPFALCTSLKTSVALHGWGPNGDLPVLGPE